MIVWIKLKKKKKQKKKKKVLSFFGWGEHFGDIWLQTKQIIQLELNQQWNLS